MAEVPGGEGGGGGGRHQKKRAKKGNTRIDMTPMVDLAFLLLTFFILTTTMYKPSTLQLTYPVPPEDEVPQPPKKVNNALTMFLTKKDQIFYYVGGFQPETQLTRSNMTDIRKTLVELNLPSIERINALTKRFNENKISELVYDSLKNMSQKQEDALYVIIKPDPDAKFRNVIDMVDEMDISGVGKFAVQDVIKPEEMALLNIEKAKF
ncbi:MAG: biopolymer transporter ExbD [Flavobacteriales bacterium]|jgi:biopolymer transport protein ExbD|nr:biopolymer transporter ExbD [Flavobacteriales bacterium]